MACISPYSLSDISQQFILAILLTYQDGGQYPVRKLQAYNPTAVLGDYLRSIYAHHLYRKVWLWVQMNGASKLEQERENRIETHNVMTYKLPKLDS